MDKSELSDKVSEELDKLPKEYITLITVNANDYLRVNLQILKFLCNNKGLYGIYVSINRPYTSSLQIMKGNDIETDNLFFVDCISILLGDTPFRTARCLFTSPENLTDIAVLIDQWVRSLPEGDKFLFLDSLSTLLIYNSVGNVTKFSHFITGKMRQWGLNGVLMSLEKENNPEILDNISQFCDRKINL
ncbi:MAG: hypothetical protein B6U72_01205 [Candidatus Altiarchaeales archaeon ex4484_2]|nr:MAG: hypothetical protein B6U72_01205 [Candidatus Altiarchaeales archaeon ex4484_2]